jgi:proline iminopeptidase
MTAIEKYLFPPNTPYRTGFLRVDDVHQLYWEECGDECGVPVVYLHGGPGIGCDEISRRFFDPKAYRIILYDQRGAGRSRPLGETFRNEPGFLVDDLEALRTKLGVEKWHVFGGSWGSTLAVLYAQEHPERCLSLILRGVSWFDTDSVDWWFGGMGRFFPELLDAFVAFAAGETRDLGSIYYDALMGDDYERRVAAARAMHIYGSGCGVFLATLPPVDEWVDPDYVEQMVAFYKLFAYYSKHHRLAPGQLLRGTSRMMDVPGVIVQGRHDIICPPIMAYRLHQQWVNSVLWIVPDGGHSSRQPSMARALIQATNQFKKVTTRTIHEHPL